MNKKFILAIVTVVFSSVFANAGGVTNIKEVLNETKLAVEVRKYDMKTLAAGSQLETTREVPADGGTWSGDMWIPWADSSNDFSEKFMEIRIDGKAVFWLWQSGEYVRYNTRARFVENGRKVPGESRAGGERRLIISMKEKTPVLTFEKF